MADCENCNATSSSYPYRGQRRAPVSLVWYCDDCQAGRPVVQREPYLLAYPYACLGAAVLVALIVCATILLAGSAS